MMSRDMAPVLNIYVGSLLLSLALYRYTRNLSSLPEKKQT